MKISPRYIRRRSRSTSREGNFFQKDNTSEQSFFGESVPESFFQQTPAALQRKCTDCEEEDKSVKRKSEAKEDEEKKLQMKGEKKEEEEKKLQRMPEKKEEEEKLQKKSGPKKEEEKEKIQKKQAGAQTSTAAKTSSYLNTLSSKGSVLPNSALQFFGQKMGRDFSQVRIHTGADAETSAKEVNAKAYAYQNHIVFNQGEYSPSTREGKKLLAHELVHIVQQKGAAHKKKEKNVVRKP